ncbi:hypothetical protein CJ030_MR1G028179 [Morella rubra]|uniref:EF-hand domain-containing protein n=1 Tax=Morella rubra TaxID=262757 RepID=A0A6A1WJ14_9ROSI|nr:hypothetical protein CJ030_MR1G028179 [Morella rubra]
MRKRDPKGSEEVPENSGSEEEPQLRTPINHGVSEYEKQRLSRIAENRARMEALGLPKIASTLWGSAQQVSNQRKNTKKGKEKVEEDDDVGGDGGEDKDYRPDEVEEEPISSSEEEANEDDDDYLDGTSSGSRRKKVKTKGSKPKKKVPAQKYLSKSDVDYDDALKQAIALSLGSAGVSGVVHSEASKCSEIDAMNDGLNEEKGASCFQEDTGKRKRKKSQFSSRLQMTEDELVMYFFQFDDEWKGGITMRDIKRFAIAHDFTWTEKELADMVHCFDSDRDGKLSLEDFQKIVGRCNMIKGPESS